MYDILPLLLYNISPGGGWMGYKILKEEDVVDYVKSKKLLNGKEFSVKQVGDGNLNNVYRVVNEQGESIVIKQALPYVKIVGDSWPLPLERNTIEAKALKIHGKYCRKHVVKVLYVDEEYYLMVMEDLSNMEVMRLGMIRMKKYPKFSEHISSYLAKTFFYTSDFFMDPIEKKELVREFINPHLCKITEDLIFTDPYYDAPRNNINPELLPYLKNKFWKRRYLWREASKMKYKFLTEAESLVHGDLHTGSIFANENETKVFDAEFAYFGPAAFDQGLLLGNILINYISFEGKDFPKDKVQDYREFILTMIEEIYEKFSKKLRKLWKKVNDISFKDEAFLDYYLKKYFEDMLGYAAVVMIRRMHGLAHNIDVDEIEDLKVRSEVQKLILDMATNIMMTRKHWKDIKEVTEYVKSFIF